MLVKLDRYSTPIIDEIIHSLKGKKIYAKLDIEDGFFRIPPTKKNSHKTAFRYNHKLSEWTVMPMESKNSPPIFQRYMDNVIEEFIGHSCFVYVDDTLIFGDDEKSRDYACRKNIEEVRTLRAICQ